MGHAYSSPLVGDYSPNDALDPASSPGPVTPFGVFVDRAVASGANRYVIDSEPRFTRATDPAYDALNNDCGADCQECQAFPHKAAPPPTIVTPSASDSYKKQTEPLSEWIAAYVWRVCTTGLGLPATMVSQSPRVSVSSNPPPAYLAGAIRSLLLSTLLQPSAIVLALKYIVRLPVYFAHPPFGIASLETQQFRKELFGDCSQREQRESAAPFRLVVLGFMLANKWLDDHTFSNKTWYTISNVPLDSLNKLESLALAYFRYDLSIGFSEWTDWLQHILAYHAALAGAPSPYPQPISRPSASPHAMIRKAFDELVQAAQEDMQRMTGASLPAPIFLGFADRCEERRQKEAAAAAGAWSWSEEFDIDLDEDGPLREEYMPKRRKREVHPPVVNVQPRSVGLPPPARWSPAADEPIMRSKDRVAPQYIAPAPQPHVMISHGQWSAPPYELPSRNMFSVPADFAVLECGPAVVVPNPYKMGYGGMEPWMAGYPPPPAYVMPAFVHQGWRIGAA